MDYEIDIEEHDVLDNPIIKSIFPDISVIKKELTQYYDEEPNTNNEAEIRPQQLPKTLQDIQSNYSYVQNDTLMCLKSEPSQPAILSNKIILGSKPNTNEQNDNREILSSNSNATQHDYNKILLLGSNPINTAILNEKRTHNALSSATMNIQDTNIKKIILGSKPNTQDTYKKISNTTGTKEKVKNIRIVLQDIKSYLNQNGRYCKQCCRLFLSKNALDIHKTKMHHNKIRKNINKKHSAETRHRCSICGIYFSNSGNLCRHYKNIHQKSFKLVRKDAKTTYETDKTIKFKKANFSNRLDETKNKVHQTKIRENKNITIKMYSRKTQHSCSICSTSFSNKGNLYRHYRNVHKKSLKFTGKDAKNTSETNINFRSKRTKSNNRLKVNEINTKIVKKQTTTGNAGKIKYKNINIRKYSKENLLKKMESDSGKEYPIPMIIPVVKGHEKKLESNKHEIVKEQPPKYVTRSRNCLSTDSNLCLHCKIIFPDQKSLIQHMYEILEPKKKSSGSIKNAVTDITRQKDDEILFVCRQCSYYFLSIQSYFTHMTKNHRTEAFLEMLKEEFDARCKYCPHISSSITAHNKHVHANHSDLMYSRVINESEKDKNNHKTCNEKRYKHAIGEFKSFALESVLFECNKCSICFLSSIVARHHEQHMEFLINWKCSICHNFLKEHDKEMHLKQHNFSQPLKVINLKDTAFYNVLYNCTKCAIHLTEKRYQEHYPNCGSNNTESSYCSVCDILVDKMEINQHTFQHRQLRDISDFIIIDSNMIENTTTNLKKKSTNVEFLARPITTLHEQHNSLTYCDTCKSFLSYSGIKKKSHIKKQCSHLLAYPCYVCGLVFTNSSLQIHKERHLKDKKLRLQDFKFFDLQGNLVRPPIPEYPRCEVCKIHFLRKNAIAQHVCDETLFLTCDICNIKLSGNTFKPHMSFHYYIMPKTSVKNDNWGIGKLLLDSNDEDLVSEVSSESIKHASKNHHELVIPKTTTETKIKPRLKVKTIAKIKKRSLSISEPLTDISVMSSDENNETTEEKNNSTDLVEAPKDKPSDEFLVVLYTCQTCDVAVESYDEVIKHCQMHYGASENNTSPITSVKKCKQCSLKFDSRLYLNHQRTIHSGVSKIQILKFDPSYFTSKNMIWVKHVFQTLPSEMVKKLLKHSIYQHEHRIKLECIQKGSSLLYVYKCDMCGNFIDPGNVYKHTENPCGNVRKHPCSICGLPFISKFSRFSHEKLHKQIKGVTKKCLNIVLFNQSKDKTFNNGIFCITNQYLLYQCRNCDRVAEKSILTEHVCDRSTLVKCITCGLLINKDDSKAHLSKHTDLTNFYSENFKVILFGCKNNSNKDVSKTLLPGFSGTVYDYTLYKCQICQICLKNSESNENHTCIPNSDLDRTMCFECDLYFTSHYIKQHMKQHRTDPDFKKENMNVIIFNVNSRHMNTSFSYPKNEKNQATKAIVNLNENIVFDTENVYELDIDNGDKENGVNDDDDCNRDKMNTSDYQKYSDNVYIERSINNTDTNNGTNENNKLSKENTTNTSAGIFKPNSICSDLSETFDDDCQDKGVKDNNEMSEDKNQFDKVDDKIVNDDQENSIVTDKSVHEMNQNINEDLAELYKCKCGLHFLSKSNAMEHSIKCQSKTKQHKQSCSKCHLLFNATELFSHLVVHHRDKTQGQCFNVIEVHKD